MTPPSPILKSRAVGFSTAFTEEARRLSTRINDTTRAREAFDLPVDLNAADGRSSQGRDAADARANYELQMHLVARAERGRSALIADMLGCFEGDAALARGRKEPGAPCP